MSKTLSRAFFLPDRSLRIELESDYDSPYWRRSREYEEEVKELLRSPRAAHSSVTRPVDRPHRFTSKKPNADINRLVRTLKKGN